MATEGSIDKLTIEVSSTAASAARDIRDLSEALSGLKGSVGKTADKLTAIAGGLNSIKSAASGLQLGNLRELNEFQLNGSAAKNLKTLATAISLMPADVGSRVAPLASLKALDGIKLSATVGTNLAKIATALAFMPSDTATRLAGLPTLKHLNGVKISATVPNNLTKLAQAVRSFPADSGTRLAGLAKSLLPLKHLNGMRITTAINGLKQLPGVLKQYETLNVKNLVAQLDMLNPRLKSLATSANALKLAFNKMPASLRTVASATRTVVSANKRLEQSMTKTNALAGAGAGIFSRFHLSIGAITTALYFAKRAFTATIGEVNTYIENMNLFEASMGKYTQSATDFGNKIQDLMGIDFGEWARNQGVFQTLITGMGDTADRAAVMSQQLTQLGYDISSFYNISVEDAMLKVQSGMAGELEPLRRIGWDLSIARMQLEATNLGIDKNVQQMTQAEKVGLRYYMIMTQVTQVHGDMARTIASPANQLRVLQAQVTLAARSIGNLLIPMLNAILPYAIGAAKAIRLLAQSIASFFGIDATFQVDYSTVDYSGIASGNDEIEDTADALDNAGAAASAAAKKVKEYQNTVMGFDELNKLNDVPDDTDYGTGSAGSGAAGIGDVGSGIDLPLDTYDFLDGLNNYITQLSDDIAQGMVDALKVIAPLVAGIGSGFAAWKIANRLGKDLKTCAGLAMAVAGGVIMVFNWLDMWVNGIEWRNLFEYLGGMALLVGGLALAFGPVAAAIGGILGLVALAAAAFHDMYENGLNWKNEIAAAISALGLDALGAALVEIGTKAEKFIGPLASGFGRAAQKAAPVLKLLGKFAGALGLVISIIDGIFNALDIFNAIKDGADISAESVFGLATSFLGIGLALAPATGGISLIVAAVAAAVAAIAALIYNNWDEICEFLSGIGAWVDENVIQPVIGFFVGLGEYLSELWDHICTAFWVAWGALAKWVDDNVIQPLIAFWSPVAQWFGQLWDSILGTAEALFHNIGVFADGCWQIVCRVWEVASQWFDQNVVQPVSSFFSGLWDTVSGAARLCWEAISAVWAVVSGWFDEHVVQPVGSFFSGLWDGFVSGARRAWQGIQNAFSSVASFFGRIFSDAWQRIISIFQYGGRIFNGVVDAIVGAFKGVVNQLISGLNWAIAQPFRGLNSILSAMRGWEILGIRPFEGFWDVPVPQIPYLAEGRYGIDAGQLFVARENGAEMVGSMSGHTTVANNQQIVEGIEQGVMSAMLQVLPAFQASREDGDVTLVLRVGNEDIARAVNKGNASMVRRGQVKPEIAFA